MWPKQEQGGDGDVVEIGDIAGWARRPTRARIEGTRDDPSAARTGWSGREEGLRLLHRYLDLQTVATCRDSAARGGFMELPVLPSVTSSEGVPGSGSAGPGMSVCPPRMQPLLPTLGLVPRRGSVGR